LDWSATVSVALFRERQARTLALQFNPGADFRLGHYQAALALAHKNARARTVEIFT